MFLYWFTPRTGHRVLFTRWLLNNFSDFFHIWMDWWTWPIDYLIRFRSIFVVILTLDFQGQIRNLICLGQKWLDCHETKSKHINWNLSLKCEYRTWSWPWPWPWSFKVKYGIHYILAKNGPIATKQKKTQTYRLNFKPQMWPSDLTLAVTLTLNFQGQIWYLLYLSQKWSDYHETKSRHIDWTLGLKCDHWIWPWLWPWLWIFKVKNAKNGLIATKWKVHIYIELKASVTIKFDLGHDLERWGVRIYRIVTGMTSDVGVPSTRLVLIKISIKLDPMGPIENNSVLVLVMACWQTVY